jgi:hypothetical protein
MHVAFEPIISIVAGVIVILFPRILNYIIGVYLLVIGILGVIR